MRAVICDLDGTLVDSSEDICASFTHALAQGGVEPPPLEELRAALGPPLPAMLARWAPGADHEELAAAYRAHYWKHCVDRTRPFVGVPEALRALRHDGWLLGVATLKRTAMARRLLDGLGMLGLVDVVQGSEGLAPKPAPDVVEHALAALGAAPSRASWMVGDTAGDVLAGRAAGLSTAGVSTGAHGRECLAEAGADVVADGFDGVLAYL